MSRTHVVRDPVVPGVVRVSRDPALPSPHVGLLGGVHGNETCGVEVIERLARDAAEDRLPLAEGTLVLVHGNPAAIAAGRRYTRGGADINRLLEFAFVDALPSGQWTPEHHRAVALRPIFEQLDCLLDLHSATADTPPFAIVNDAPGAVELGRQVGVRYLSHGWEAVLSEQTTIGVLARRGRPAVSIECGQHDAPSTLEAAFHHARCFLSAAGVLDHPRPTPDAVDVLELTEAIHKPSADFRFARPLRGFERLEAGEVLGTHGGGELRVSYACVVMLPNDAVPVGDQVAYLARPPQPA